MVNYLPISKFGYEGKVRKARDSLGETVLVPGARGYDLLLLHAPIVSRVPKSHETFKPGSGVVVGGGGGGGGGVFQTPDRPTGWKEQKSGVIIFWSLRI